MTFIAADQDARDRARTSRGESLVLEAGAGTGKTTLLVDRIESLLRSGDATVTQIAAVTFTENAAATMKLRLRERLERVRAGDAPDEERARAARALESLERAQVSTIHAFCQAILQERPLECGVPPAFRVIDEAQADALFGESWDEWLVERLDDADPVLAEAVRAHIPLTGYRGQGESTSLRGLARTLLWERDLAPLVAAVRPDPEAWRAELQGAADRARELRAAGLPGDYLYDDLLALEEYAASCAPLRGTVLRDRLLALPKLKADRGKRGSWRTTEALAAGRDLLRSMGEAAERWRQEAGCGLHADLVGALQGVLRRYEEKKRRQGVLDFVDLLVKARDGLRDRPGVRHHVRQRFAHLLIDEFQDTDPLQVQVVRAIAADDPGRLVVVGDAKQSIYRFRRADVALFRRMSEEAAQRPGHAVLHLRQSFRARPGLLRFVNRAFAELIAASREADQPAYEPIVPPPGLDEGPAVVALRFEAPALAAADDLLQPEAAALAAFIADAARGAHTVRDPGSGETRKSRAGDVMVLAPRLTQIRHLEDALDAAGVAFAVEGGKSFFNRQEVHEVLAVLRAVDDPSDRASLVAALRSSFFGVSDRDIVAYALSRGLLEVGTEGEAGLPGGEIIAPALELLTRLHCERLRLSVPALLERLYDETRVLASLTGTRRGEARISNLEKVTSLARQADGVGVLTLRGFTRLLAARMQDSSEEPDLPASRPEDPSTVRILSIHKAKGLEAPIVVLHDMAASLITQPSVIALWDEGKIAVGFRKGYRPPDWNALAQRDEVKARAEGRRLLYVACTRARDLMVVPRPPTDAQVGDFWRDLLPHLDCAGADEARIVDAGTLPAFARGREGFDRAALVAAEGGDGVAARWQQRRGALLAEAARRPLAPVPVSRAAARTAPVPVSAPALAPTGDTAATLIDPTARGRDFGSLVHRILEWIPLHDSTPPAVAAMASALAPSFGVGADAAVRAAETASRVLALPLLDRARAARRVFRELLVWFPEGEELMEGVVDLVFEEEGGLVVVDYKTDHITPEQAVEQAAHHAPQLQLYGRGLAQATGITVVERLVLFTALGRAVEV